MSPEQALDPRQVDPAADLWSLAMITYQCLVGRRAIQGRNLALVLQALASRNLPVPSEHGELPSSFDNWFKKATDQDPRARYLNTESFVESLRRSLEPTSPAIAEKPPLSPMIPWGKLGVWGLVFVLAAGALIGIWWTEEALESSSAELATPGVAGPEFEDVEAKPSVAAVSPHRQEPTPQKNAQSEKLEETQVVPPTGSLRPQEPSTALESQKKSPADAPRPRQESVHTQEEQRDAPQDLWGPRK